MAFENFLDFRDFLVNDVAGSPLIFVFLACVIIYFVCAQFRFPNSVTLMIIAVFFVFMGFIYSWMWWVVILFVGVFAFWQLVKPLTRG